MFLRVPSTLDFLRSALRSFVDREGTELMTDDGRSRQPVSFVGDLLSLHAKFCDIVRYSFNGANDKSFDKTLKDAFENFMNADTRCSQ